MTANADSDSTTNSVVRCGSFSDGAGSTFHVFASSSYAPGALFVHYESNRADAVLIVTGLSSGNPRASWGPHWRATARPWQRWCQEAALHVFYNGGEATQAAQATATGRARVCDG